MKGAMCKKRAMPEDERRAAYEHAVTMLAKAADEVTAAGSRLWRESEKDQKKRNAKAGKTKRIKQIKEKVGAV